MPCPLIGICGGCPQRHKDLPQYRQDKISSVERMLSALPQPLPWETPIFISDGTRRRAAMTFHFHRGQLVLGFNQSKSKDIVDVSACLLLTPKLNAILPWLRQLLHDICSEPYQLRKGKKNLPQTINSGDVWLCEADNGIDVVLEYDAPLELNHRMIIFEAASAMPDVVRISHRRTNTDMPEPIIEKAKPYIKIGNVDVFIPAGTFLQPSKAGENALVKLVLNYLSGISGKVILRSWYFFLSFGCQFEQSGYRSRFFGRIAGRFSGNG